MIASQVYPRGSSQSTIMELGPKKQTGMTFDMNFLIVELNSKINKLSKSQGHFKHCVLEP